MASDKLEWFREDPSGSGKIEIPTRGYGPSVMGWYSEIERMAPYWKLILLRREGSAAVEGVYTCATYEGSVSVRISHPSEFVREKNVRHR